MEMFKPLPNIRPPEQTVGPCRKIVLHPIMPLSGLALAMFFFAFFGEHRFVGYAATTQLTFISIWACIFFVAFYWFSGRTMNFLMSRNIPFAWNSFILISAVAFLEAGFAWWISSENFSWKNFLWHGFSTQMAFVPVIIICAMFFEKRLRNIYSAEPENVPFWWPVERNTDGIQSLLPREYRGKLLKLTAANQYVQITTDRGTYEIRSSLKALLDSVPSNEGIHLHRSVWLRKELIKNLTYENGNPVVVDADGNMIPVGRTRVNLVKEFLETA